MTRKKGAWSSETFESTAATLRAKGGPVTFRGEQRSQEGRGLNPLIDPRTHDARREALNLLVKHDDAWRLDFGIAMPVTTALDTTGSMGRNVDIAFGVIPSIQSLFVQGAQAVLSRYHVQFATAVIQDVGDEHPYQHSEYEPDNEMEVQMQMLVPERSGGDSTEDYQLDLWYTAFRVRTMIVNYGLKGYHFIVGDERGRDYLRPGSVSRVFGVDDLQSNIGAEELGHQVLQGWHTFFLQVGDLDYTTVYWAKVLGRDRVVILPRTENIAEVQAVIIGLTEGVLDLQSAADFLTDFARTSPRNVENIVRAVAHVPLRVQADLPNFGRIPPAGSIFASREDTWPIGDEPVVPAPTVETPEDEIDWNL